MTGKIGTVCKFFVIYICLHNANLNSKNVFLANDVKKKNISRRNLLNVKRKSEAGRDDVYESKWPISNQWCLNGI